LTHGVVEAYLLVYMRCCCSNNLHPSCWKFLGCYQQVDDAVGMIRRRFTSHLKQSRVSCQVPFITLPCFLHNNVRCSNGCALQSDTSCHTDMTGLCMQVHVAVAGTETDHLAKLINEKAEELDAACVIMASHGKTSFQVTLQKLPRILIMARFMLDSTCTL